MAIAADHRVLNKITKYPQYPMPVIDDILRSLPSVKFMSTLDLTSGYHQIAMSSKDIKKTAFNTKYGLFAFLRMPFGLSGAPATFRRVMDEILRPGIGRSCTVYLDDVIIGSEAFEQHMRDLEEVFRLLEGAGLTANVENIDLKENN